MPNKSKIKGDGYERELVNICKEHNVPAVRARGSDGRSLGEHETVDVLIGSQRIQAKRYKKFPAWSKFDPKHVDAIVYREDYSKEHFVLLTLESYMALIKEKESVL